MKSDVIVIGAGHAGSEAAAAIARLGLHVTLITLRKDRIAWMSCNPAIGGIGKGHLVKEVDALNGLMGIAADRCSIQRRTLNTQKGYAVRATRFQCDMYLYSKTIAEMLSDYKNIEIIEDEVIDLSMLDAKIHGVQTAGNGTISAKAVVLVSGTFLDAIMHRGENIVAGGRSGEKSASLLSKALKKLGLDVRRFKTGTPPRLDPTTIDFSILEPQHSDANALPFSTTTTKFPEKTVPCHITYTNQKTHEIILANIHRAPMFNGQISSRGPRYCPSIEDKVFRFRDKPRHQIFLEPVSLASGEIYPNGISTSLPIDVQIDFIRTIKGLECAEILKPGYAVEYDFVHPSCVLQTLETRKISGLYLAGQLLGTTGYEEAASLGLVAGANAALKILGREPLIFNRGEAYIGVMIDDLTTKGVTEPYRMFTSRAEYRLTLREENAWERLTEKGRRAGIVTNELFSLVKERSARIEAALSYLVRKSISPDNATNRALVMLGLPAIADRCSMEEYLRRPGITLKALVELLNDLFGDGVILNSLTRSEAQEVETRIKYSGYIDRQKSEIRRLEKMDSVRIPYDFDYNAVNCLSLEIRERLSRVRPETLGQASRLEGITPAAISALILALSKG